MINRSKILILFGVCMSCYGFDASKLSLEEKVGQLLMVHFHGEIANEEAKSLVQDTKVGGIIYYRFSNGLKSPEQVRTLSEGLQALASANPIPIPLLIALDQEGGIVAQLSHGFTQFPGNRALGETNLPELAEEAAFMIGQELQAVGVNMNLAPVVDINSNPRNPIIGIRSFGEDPDTVIAFGESSLHGYRAAQVVATLKHFPGHGDVAVDSHLALPEIRKTKEELQRFELRPFEALAAKADAIMTAHILVPALDPEHCSTLSKNTMTYLRETIGFQGVIVTDSLVMEGVMKQCQSIDEAAIRALDAGCDLLLLGGKLLWGEKAGFELTSVDIRRIHRALVDAVKSGRVSEEKVTRAAQTILDLKSRRLASRIKEMELSDCVNTASHRALSQKIASMALKITENEPTIPFYEQKIAVFAPELLSSAIDQTSLLNIGKETKTCFFSSLAPTDAEIEMAREQVQEADALLVCAYNAWKNPSQEAFIQSLLGSGKPVVLLNLRDPLDAALFPSAHLIFSTFSPSVASIQAVCDVLNKRKKD